MVEVYCGPKFEPVPINREIPNHPAIGVLRKWCRIFHEQGLAPPYEGGSYGNLSFKLPRKGGIIITASQSSLGDSDANDRFVTVTEVDFDHRLVYHKGVRNPSSEAMLHYAVYDFRRDVNAVFHGHSKDISSKAEELGIPTTKQFEPYGTIELIETVTDILDGCSFIEMRNHGFLSLGKTMEEAGQQALEFLRKAKALQPQEQTR